METHRRELQEHQRKKRSNKCIRGGFKCCYGNTADGKGQGEQSSDGDGDGDGGGENTW